jgi:hypothetical protein
LGDDKLRAPNKGGMASLDARLQQLQAKYNELSARCPSAGRSMDATAWPSGVSGPHDLWTELYGPYLQWVQWAYVVPSGDDMMALVRFNVAVSISRALRGSETPVGPETLEPVLDTLPPALCAPDAEPCGDGVPLWTPERLEAYIRALPPDQLLQRHAIPKGLWGVARGVPRVPPLDLGHLVQGQGWAPAPDAANYQDTAAMTGAGAPLDMDALFGTL